MSFGRSVLSRLRAAVPASRVNLFVHAGNSLAVCASMSEDMVSLRGFMIGASSCSMAFNMLQPAPLWTPVYWGGFFAAMHAYQLGKIFREQQSAVSLSGREHELYESAFLPHGFTPRQFLRLMQTGEFVTLEPGEWCALQGEPVEALFFVTGISPEASVELQQLQPTSSSPHDGPPVQDVSKEMRLLRRVDSIDGVLSRVEPASLGSGAEAVRFDSERSQRALQETGSDSESVTEEEWMPYSGLGTTACRERAACTAFRETHAISDEQHGEALRAAGADEARWRARPDSLRVVMDSSPAPPAVQTVRNTNGIAARDFVACVLRFAVTRETE
ncbi:hypothetical protein EMIHUDRAFT_447764 [Emiliania huxleyi CCMP1516]|uniref:Cyclic nucleotide-binding domain-containing protein n=2 Tax=Emiliania huxleyi TaxID=2903 RepID=A0A0D3JHL2_EMIH1|nr:hypothetical protein EMIHUDRAFT_447764 [Emiliania huxleyi CCMP1516]EOD22997.1 hypothetical protein EMIHUDRAFT_447764 [Emiliania huxleyi CCMP1516]|eukprot:XP_005775426.1 hypothetical protein EMIHUDRAFT_447764 [Emiliania huxleyi CCMP1516]